MKKNPIYARKLESVKNHNFVYKETEWFTESCIANFLTIDYFPFSSSYLWFKGILSLEVSKTILILSY